MRRRLRRLLIAGFSRLRFRWLQQRTARGQRALCVPDGMLLGEVFLWVVSLFKALLTCVQWRNLVTEAGHDDWACCFEVPEHAALHAPPGTFAAPACSKARISQAVCLRCHGVCAGAAPSSPQS